VLLGAVVSFLLTASPVGVAVRGDCVDDEALRAALQAHVGVEVVDVVNVLDGTSARVIDIAFDCVAANNVGVALELTIDGAPHGHRELGPFVDVDRAFDAAVFAASLVIDPLALDAPTDVSTPLPTTPTLLLQPAAPSPPEVPVDDVPHSNHRIPPVVVGLAIGGGVSGGLSPGASPGLLARLHLDVGIMPLVVALGVRIEAPPTLVLDAARQLESTAGAFFVDGCYRKGLVAEVVADLCVTGEGGVLRAYGVGLDNAQSITARIMTLGATLSVRAPLVGGLGVFARASANSALLRARLFADGEVVWSNPPVGGLLVVGIDGMMGTGGSP
jgi:hypothetical protein